MILHAIGIDPGKKGGLGLLRYDNGIVMASCRTMPLNSGGTLDLPKVLEWVQQAPIEGTIVVIEKQMPRRMQGVKRAGVMMEEYGKLLGLLHEYDVVEVKPKEWQAVMIPDAPTGCTKQCSIARVHRDYPELDLRRTARCREDHDGMADAILLAEWGAKHPFDVIEKLLSQPT